MADERTVYIIGAGFSHGYDGNNFPLMAGFCDKLNKEPISKIEETILQDIFNELKRIDIEDAMAYCDLVASGAFIFPRKSAGIKIHDREFALQLSSSLRKYIGTRLQIDINIPPNSPYLKWIKSIGEADTIITYNYDLLLENLLKEAKLNLYENLRNEIENTYESSDKSPFFKKEYLLKLHGSINWYTCSNPVCPNHRIIRVSDPANVSKESQDAQFYFCRNCSSSLDPVLIYPGMIKQFHEHPKVSHQWYIAHSKLVNAQRIVSIGYSFRQQDIATSFLLRKALNSDSKKWIIIDPNPENVKKRLSDLLPWRKRKLEACQTFKSIADYMKKHQV
jgi:NAD-dependent SIR2 family protein deacetylase